MFEGKVVRGRGGEGLERIRKGEEMKRGAGECKGEWGGVKDCYKKSLIDKKVNSQ